MEHGTVALPPPRPDELIHIAKDDLSTSTISLDYKATQLSMSPESPTMESNLPVPAANMGEAAMNITLTTIGVGCLSLPYCISILGPLWGLTTIFILAFATFYALYVLTEAIFTVQATGYTDVMEKLFGKTGTALMVAIPLYSWSGSISFLIIIKTSLGELLEPVISERVIPKEVWMVLVVTMVVFPLSLLRNVGKLWFTSTLGCICSLLITTVVVVCAPWNNGNIVPDNPYAYETTETSFMSTISVLPLITYALNMSLAYIANIGTLRRPTTPRVLSVITISLLPVVASYVALGIVGYLSYGNKTKDNILSNLSFPLGSWRYVMAVIARAAPLLQLSFVLPIRFILVRVFIEQSFPRFGWTRRLYHVTVTFMIVASATILAIPPWTLSGIIGIVSSTVGIILMYIGPASCDLAILLNAKKRAGSVSPLVWREHNNLCEEEKNSNEMEGSFHEKKMKTFTLSSTKQNPLEKVVKWTRTVLSSLLLGYGTLILVLGTVSNSMKLFDH